MAFGRKAAQIAELQASLAEAQERNEQLSDEIALINVVNGVASAVRTKVEELEGRGLLRDEAASVAEVAVYGEEEARLREDLKTRMITDMRRRHAATFVAGQGLSVRASVSETLESDGTFDRIRAEVEGEETQRIYDEVIAEYQDSVRKGLQEPESESRLREQAKEAYSVSDDAVQFRDQVERELRGSWHAEVQDEVKAEIRQDVESTEGEYRQSIRPGLAEGREIQHYRNQVTKDRQTHWASAELEVLKAAVLGEVDRAVIEERTQQIKAEVEAKEKEEAQADFTRAFERLGVDTTAIPEGSRVYFALGRRQAFTVKRKDSRGYQIDVSVPGAVYERRITATSIDSEGHFVVEEDTMANSSSPHEQKIALKKGTVVIFGRQLMRNGKPEFERRVSADMNLLYDDDTTTPDILTDTHQQLVNMQIEDMNARQFEHIERKY